MLTSPMTGGPTATRRLPSLQDDSRIKSPRSTVNARCGRTWPPPTARRATLTREREQLVQAAHERQVQRLLGERPTSEDADVEKTQWVNAEGPRTAAIDAELGQLVEHERALRDALAQRRRGHETVAGRGRRRDERGDLDGGA